MERQRQVAVINTFYKETLGKDVPQVARYTHGDIPTALLTQKYVIVCTVFVLPDLDADNYTTYLNNYDSQDLGFLNHWYNKEEKVGIIR